MRRSLQQEAPIAIAIDKPDTDKGSQDAVHPGAAAYYSDNEKSFMDSMATGSISPRLGFSGLGSGLAAMFSVTRARARRSALALIDQLIDLKQMAHTTTSLARLSELESGIEDLSTKGLRFARDHNFDEAGLAALRLAIDEARRAVNDQYNALQDKPALITNRGVGALANRFPSPLQRAEMSTLFSRPTRAPSGKAPCGAPRDQPASAAILDVRRQ